MSTTEQLLCIRAGVRLQLQAALASIRTGRPEDAVAYIERALDIQARWAGATISEAGDTPVTGTAGGP
jgi:hypothetical protein